MIEVAVGVGAAAAPAEERAEVTAEERAERRGADADDADGGFDQAVPILVNVLQCQVYGGRVYGESCVDLPPYRKLRGPESDVTVVGFQE